MRAFAIYCLIGIFAAAGAACGGSKEEAKSADQATQAAETSTPQGGSPAQEAAQGMEQFATAMQQLQKGPNGEALDPVDFKALQALLPDVDGWEKEKPRGESMTAPVRFSQAETAYTKGDARIEMKIIDTTSSQLLTLPYQMFMMANYSRQTDSGYEKATKIAGHPAWEKWESDGQHAEVGVLVGQRFVLTLEGNGTDVRTVHDVMGKVDLVKLAGLK